MNVEDIDEPMITPANHCITTIGECYALWVCFQRFSGSEGSQKMTGIECIQFKTTSYAVDNAFAAVQIDCCIAAREGIK